MGNKAFSECYSLTNIDLKNTEYIANDAFNDCKKLTNIYINGDLNGNNGIYKVINGKKLYKISNNSLIIDIEK
ncbi:MAG: leucine-rich repeat protein [Metamycoplasmataceae bacterium]